MSSNKSAPNQCTLCYYAGMLLIGSGTRGDSPRATSRKVARLTAELERLEAAHGAAREDRRLLEHDHTNVLTAASPIAGGGFGDEDAHARTGPLARAAHVLSQARKREEAFALALAACRRDLEAIRAPDRRAAA